MLIWGDALAAPIGGEIVGGSGSVTQQGAETTIVQSSDRLAIDWQAFDLGENERVEFIQPGKSAVALNRILSDKGSEILGRIDANGHVILVNPNGVVFGQGAVVNAGGLIASGLQINPDDFMNGDLIFKRIEDTDGTVINTGLINAASGGNVALIGTQVENRGLISATLGSVTLASGAEAVLTFDDSGLLGVQVDKAVLQSELGDKAAITNAGELRAEGGRILLSASTTRDVFSQAVNWGEQKQARSVTYSDDGSFTLGAGGDVVNSGTITTSGSMAGDIVVLGENITHSGSIRADSAEGRAGHVELHANTTTKIIGDSETTANAEQGGDIKLLGQNIGLFDRAKVEAIGTNGGGLVLVGGDKEGQNQQVRNADFVYASEDSSLDVSASRVGNGGTAIIFAEDTARVYGNISARGGSQQGNGGFVETSGKRGFSIKSAPDVSAMDGKWGHWLIDPYNITVTSQGESLEDGEFESQSDSKVSVDAITTVLSGGGNVTLTTGGSEGNITISAPIEVSLDENATLNLLAHDDIIINENIQATGSNQLNLNLHANRSNKETEGGSVKFGMTSGGAITIQTNGGDFKIAKIDGNSVDAVSPGAYDIDLRNASISVGSGDFVAHAANKLTLGQNLNLGGGDLVLGAADWDFGMPGRSPAVASISAGKGNIIFYTSGELGLPYIKSAGDITLNVRDTKENGEFKVHNKRQSGVEWRDFSLGGTLTLNLGSQGSAEIHNIKNAEDSDNDITFVVTGSKMDQDQGDPRVDLQTFQGAVLGEINLKGGFSLAADGAIKQEPGGESLNIVGESKFFSSELNLNNSENSFAKAVSIGGSANRVVLKASGDLTLADAKQQKGFGSLEVEAAGGHIQQEGALKVSGEAVLSAGKITLNNSDNDFNKISISKAESAEIVDSGDLDLNGATVTSIFDLKVSKNLSQSGALDVGELNLSVEENTDLSGNGNFVDMLSGNVKTGQINVEGHLKLGNFEVKNTRSSEKFHLTLGGRESSLSQSDRATLTIGSGVEISASDVTLNSNIKLSNNADLAINDVRTFILSGSVRGDSAGANSLTVNGVSGQEGNYEIKDDASWQNIAFHINGDDTGVLQGPDSDNTWSIKTDGVHKLFTGGRQLSFEGMKLLKGGSDTDTLDYSEFFDGADITLWNLPEISTIEDIEVVKGSGNQALVAPADTISNWNISTGGVTIKSTLISELNNTSFQGFTILKGGSGVDKFIVQLGGPGFNASVMNYTLYGGGGEDSVEDSLQITGGTDDWTKKYEVVDSVPKFSFSHRHGAISIAYDGIESINLADPSGEIQVMPGRNKIRLGPGWWELEGYNRVTYGGGLQDLIVDGNGDSISLAADENDRPPEAANLLPESLTLKNGSLSFGEGVQLEAKNLHLIGLQGDIGTIESPLEISVETLNLKDNNGNIYISESDGVTLAEVSGVGDGKSIDLEVKMGNLNQDSAITMSNGSLNLRALSGNIVLDNDGNKLNVPISLSASGSATVYTKGSLELGEVGVKNLTLRAEEGISSNGSVVVEGGTRLVSGGNISLEKIGNNFGSVPAEENNFGRVSIEGIGGNQVDVNLVDSNELRLADVNISGDLVISAKKLSFNDLTIVGSLEVTAEEVVVNQLVLAKWNVFFKTDEPVRGWGLIHSEHGEIFGVRTLTAADQMIEIEALAEIDPAIFTNVKNYFHQDVSVLLPADQRYDDSGEEDSLAEIDLEFFTDVKNYSYQDVSVQLPLNQL